MFENIKEKIKEIAEIAESCPKNLQEKCFEVLLWHLLGKSGPFAKETIGEGAATTALEATKDETAEREEEDLTEKDVHVKARRFLEKNGLSVDDLNQIFYKEGDEIKPLYEDLRTTEVTESQLRIALLEALKNGVKTGEFSFDLEFVREECKTRKCYDVGNYIRYYKNNEELFDDLNSHKKNKMVKLSDRGKKKLADVIKEIQ